MREAKAYCTEVREKTAAVFGPWPEKTPLNPRTTGEKDHGAYRLRSVVFESRPGFLVTGNIYFPANIQGLQRLRSKECRKKS